MALNLFFRSTLIFCFTTLHIWNAAAFAQDNQNNLPGVTVQLPTLGVAVDVEGVLSARIFPDPTGQLNRKRLQAAKNKVPGILHQSHGFRKISLRRLELEIQKRIRSKTPLPDEIKFLAGLIRIEYIFLHPDTKDIIIAGPAEPWVENLAGRMVGANTGRPIMLLEDWLTSLRTFHPKSNPVSWVACSIDPTAQGLENLKTFQTQLPRNVAPNMKQVAATELTRQLRQSLGKSDVRVFGVNPKTHAARVMVEADYRMKMIAIGLEIPPPPIRTFVRALKGAPSHFQRWWLVPDYKCLKQTEDGLALQVKDSRVVLQTETITFDQNATIQRTAIKPSRAARTYADSFTEHFGILAAARPVFSQLRNVMNALILGAWLRQQNAYQQVDWLPTTLLDENQLPVANHEPIRQADGLANGLWKNNVLLLPSGGVSIYSHLALKTSALEIESDGELAKTTKNLTVDENRWWWD